MGLIRAAAVPAHPRIRPGSAAFSALLGLLAALPTFGIDMILPSLSDTAAALNVPPSAMGAAMGAYLLGLGGRCWSTVRSRTAWAASPPSPAAACS
ncbi:hypothetical protein [Methylobacterium tardum]|uniref:hypothetical protein n=1 Tax=Methylobacterium tardum TaxID=374432 RepID=UPI00360B58D4